MGCLAQDPNRSAFRHGPSRGAASDVYQMRPRRRSLNRDRDAFELRLVARQTLRVGNREPCHLRLRCRRIGPGLQESSAANRYEVRERPPDDAQTSLDKPQVAEDLRLEQADGATGRRIAELGKNLSVTAAPPNMLQCSGTRTFGPAAAREQAQVRPL